MAGNTVTLSFAGDSASLNRTFDSVGSSAVKAAGDFDKAGVEAKAFGSRMDSVGGAVGNAEGKFSGMADLLDGLGGAFGLPTEQATGLMRSFGDLSGGFETVQGLFTSGLGKVKQFASAVANSSMVTKVWTGIQAAFNAVMALNPVILIVAAIVALGVALVVAYQKSETFRKIVDAAFQRVKDIAMSVMDFFKSIPEKLGALGKGIFDVLVWPYKTAFNLIAKLWNNTVGKLEFEIPSWVPLLGGKGFKMPKLPTFHAGGTVPGIRGTEVPIMARAGEHFTQSNHNAPSGTAEVRVYIDGREIQQSLLRLQRLSGNLGIVGA